MKKIIEIIALCLIFFIFAIILTSPIRVWAISENGYVLNVVQDGAVIKEIDKQVVLPFETEYNLLLKADPK